MSPITHFADTSWPDAALGIAGIALVGSVIVVIIWQALATWRTRLVISREQRYQQLTEEIARELKELNRPVGERGPEEQV